MIDGRDLGFLLALARFPKFGARRISMLRKIFPSFETAFSAHRTEFLLAGIDERITDEFLSKRNQFNPEEEKEQLERHNVTVVVFGDPFYPQNLTHLYDPPALLFLRGTLPPKDALCVALVGSRHPTEYGRRVVQTLAEYLAIHGTVIVSGMAYGIDALAHQAVSNVRGMTLAVLGSGLDANSIYPAGHRALAEKILETGGALLSEFPIGTPGLSHHFPLRNRIIAGLCQGTVVIEAAITSGSLITAKAALDIGRDVFAVPGSIYNPLSTGTNELIKTGAHVVTCPEDILSVLGATPKDISSTPVPPVDIQWTDPLEEKIYTLLSSQPIHIDELARQIREPTSVITAAVSMLELKGLTTHVGGMFYVK
ncbi:MAG: protecting protein DprA protein [Candidatus Uhrbacteria bacterium GW2011_GWF2_41_16]|uniref:Protecting protein DprA protein n=2 Tax=Candidatus Uhriibacteriota TaxID=1752732 RepID=A0A0G0VCY8_9BACT|nr:MAG: protecting protein DprA protein [Candidatus Uhrbacteria bacterium GW2011_GWA2_41_10]KKR87814.1 MAG: protecting protein DprA protein [Candidatus Uhrbacteria bacterium GW2011_GWC2_41_11]KKR98753.1 MAG: protecting protein DprA protein [Candidatus Uhrbacteria bacterium GW2011_GWF2_41_16]HBP00129.1 DNA-protecting protein DprA [Candidatus Uhrbacteria bacterium]